MAGYIKTFVREWNPVRNRRMLIQSKLQLANCQNGWSNTHIEMLRYKDKCEYLESEVARLERLNNG